jgi:hypothetical protein
LEGRIYRSIKARLEEAIKYTAYYLVFDCKTTLNTLSLIHMYMMAVGLCLVPSNGKTIVEELLAVFVEAIARERRCCWQALAVFLLPILQ